MKHTLLLLFLACSLPAFAQTPDKAPSEFKLFRVIDKQRMQGAAFYDGRFYQFYDKGFWMNVYDANNGRLLGLRMLPCGKDYHFGSVSFSNTFGYTDAEGRRVELTTPLAYVSGHFAGKEAIGVVDVENGVLVREYKFPNRRDDVIAAYDFPNQRGWIVGYEPKTGYATTDYHITEFRFDDASPDGFVLGKTTVLPNEGTLQDCLYLDGHIYIVVGWGRPGNHIRLLDYNTQTCAFDVIYTTPATEEAEGLAYDPTTDTFFITSDKGHWYRLKR